MSAQFHTIAPANSHIRIKEEKPIVQQKLDTIAETPIAESPSNSIDWCHPPLKGSLRISSKFGTRRNPFGKKKTEHHSGMDLSAKAGTPIHAMLPGEVAHVGYDNRSGNFIKLKHGNFTISYCHLIRKPNIPVGSRVMPGQIVAHVGSTGRSTGPHLHITLKRNGRVLDPAILLDYISQY